MKRVRLVTHNAHKFGEIRAILEPLGVNVRDLSDLPAFEVVEDGDTFEANAIKKALATQRWANEPTLADDSGLMVDALDGAPGVHSARYSGVCGSGQDAANRDKLHEALQGITQPSARFVCVLAYAVPGQTPLIFRGELEGIIAPEDRGTNGFGYDPMFMPLGSNRTLAEHTADEKNRISHRARALHALLRHFQG